MLLRFMAVEDFNSLLYWEWNEMLGLGVVFVQYPFLGIFGNIEFSGLIFYFVGDEF